MTETLQLARLGVRALLKDRENALKGRVQDTGTGGPTVPEEVPAMDQDKPLSKVLYDAVRLLEAGLITDKGTMSDNDTLEISRTLTYFRQKITKGDVPISVKAIVKDPKGRILVMRDAYSDYWDLPGGHVQEGETLMHAMTRELLEETGLGAGEVRQTDTRMLDFSGEVKPVCMYEVEFIGGTPRISTEHLGFQWADPRELPKLNLGVYKDILLPQHGSNENLEELLEADTIVEKEGDGGSITGAGDTMIGDDVHTDAIGSPKRSVFKALAEPELMDEFIQNFHKNVLVTGDSPMPEGEEIELRGNKVVKGLRSNYFENTDMLVLHKDVGSPFIVAGYASPVVIDQEGHRVSHHALAEDLPRFMANNGEYSNLNVIHCLVPETPILVRKNGKLNKQLFKRIDELQVGDLVYTHRGRKRPITYVNKQWTDEEIVVLNLENNETVKITGDHEVLTTNGWVPASELTIFHELMHSQHRPSHSEETKEKRRNSLMKSIKNRKKRGPSSELSKLKSSITNKKFGPRPWVTECGRYMGKTGLGAKKTAENRRGKSWAEVYGEDASIKKLEKHSLYVGPLAANWRGGPDRPGSSANGYSYHWNDIRKEILKRDGYACIWCNRTDSEVRKGNGNHSGLHVDHIDSNVTNNEDWNLQTLCPSCHSKKTRNDDKLYNRSIYKELMQEKIDYSLVNGNKILGINKEHYVGWTYCLSVKEDASYRGNGIVYHNSNLTVGKIIPEFTSQMGKTYRTEVDDIGLFVVAEVRTDPYRPEVVNQVIEDIEAGKLKSFSISGNAENPVFTCDKQRCFYNIDKVNLFEITLCLCKNTNILTKQGYKYIQDVELGDLVKTHTGNWQPVTGLRTREINEKIVVIETKDGITKLTKNHPIRVVVEPDRNDEKRYDWVYSFDIRPGFTVQADSGEVKVLNINYEDYQGWVYNLDVQEDESYTTQACVVHNCEQGVNQDAKFEVISHP